MYNDPFRVVLPLAIFMIIFTSLFMLGTTLLQEYGKEDTARQQTTRAEHNAHMEQVKANLTQQVKDGAKKTFIEEEMNGFIELECGDGYSIMVDSETGVHYGITTTKVSGGGFAGTRGHGQDLTPQYDSSGNVIIEPSTVLQALRNDYVYRQSNGLVDSSKSSFEGRTQGTAG